MLNEELQQYRTFGSFSDILYCAKSIHMGVRSKTSMYKYFLIHKGQSTLNVPAALLLFSELEFIVQLDGDNFYPTEEFLSICGNEQLFQDLFIHKVVQYVITNQILHIENIKFNDIIEGYIFPPHGISLKNAGFRNLLIAIGELTPMNNRSFICGSRIISLIKPQITKGQRIKSEKELLEQLEQKRIQGELGEEFVIEYEKKRLSNHPKKDLITRISVIDVGAGYDVVSYNTDESNRYDRYIEVKTYKGVPHFYWSINEWEIANLRGNEYFIYLVDYTKISEDKYTPIIIQNPACLFKNSNSWSIEPNSFLIQYADISV